ncbi:MAG: ATP-dependent zinc protease [Gammaproteobacteria bacterium]|nr:ATP-dependent zinc protease [Gammaproteobacteria bacterium]
MSKKIDLSVIGWREWVALPDLKIDQIKCKVDTGAKTSALHAYFIEPLKKSGCEYVRFGMHPVQKNSDTEVICTSKVHDQREITDSGGHREKRYVILTTIKLGQHNWQAEVTLTDRETMLFRMLLGRDAIKNQFIVNPTRSYLIGKKRKKKG